MSLSNQLNGSPTTVIPVVALGVYRNVATSMDAHFLASPYRMAAVLDLSGEPEAVRYSTHNLSVVLHALNPRPMVFITGASISHDMTAEAMGIFEDYLTRTGVGNTMTIRVSSRVQGPQAA